MTTIVDALIVTLGLDGSQFKKGAKQSTDEMRKMTEQSEQTAKVMEAKGKQAAEFYTKIRNEALLMLGVFTGGRALKNFAEDTINSAANLGFMADNLKMSTERLSAWQRAADRAGSSASGITAQLEESQAAAAKHAMGMSDDSMQWFYRMGGSDKDLQDGNSYLLARADIIAKLNAVDPGRAKLVAQAMGISPEQFNLVKQGAKGLEDLVKAQEKNSAVTRKQAEEAQNLKVKFLDLRDRIQLTATTVLLKLAPAIERGVAQLQKMADWVADHKEDISKWVDGAVRAFEDFIAMLDRAAQAVGGWKNVLIALAALKLLSTVSTLVSLATGLSQVGTALGLISSEGAAIGVLGTLGSTAGAAALSVGALAGVTFAMGKALQELDKDTDPINHPGKRRVRRRGHPDEWVTDPTLPQEHAGEHFQRAGRGGAWVKDSDETEKKDTSVVPDWLKNIFGGNNTYKDSGRSRQGRARGGKPDEWVNGGEGFTKVKPAETDATALSVTKKLIDMGWSPQQAAGITGSLQQESGLNPAAVNPKSGAYGIGQWLSKDRIANFKSVMGKELVGSTLDEQLAFQQWELNNTEKRSGDMLKAAKTAADAAAIHSLQFERPGDNEAHVENRQANANAILSALQTNNAASAATLPTQAGSAVKSANVTNAPSQTIETNFSGPITINTQATDAAGIAGAFKNEVNKIAIVPQANRGIL